MTSMLFRLLVAWVISVALCVAAAAFLGKGTELIHAVLWSMICFARLCFDLNSPEDRHVKRARIFALITTYVALLILGIVAVYYGGIYFYMWLDR